jgi:acyl-CoA hydrolase
MSFLRPVHVGDIVKTWSQVNWAGRSSMEIGVRVEAQPWGNAADEPVHVASAYFVFVAIDEDGAPRAVPGLLTETPSEVRREREAQIRRAHRLARKAEIDRGRGA